MTAHIEAFVGIASSGRDALLKHALESISRQTSRPKAVLISTPSCEATKLEGDWDNLQIIWLKAEKGSCSQRNAILDYLSGAEGMLLIMDDDFILHTEYLERVRDIVGHSSIAIANGALVADGITGPGLSPVDAVAWLSRVSNPPPEMIKVEDTPTIYGCNMAMNLDLARQLRFDENMPLYGWQEDVDFSARLKMLGRVVKTNLVAGIHLGVKVGRTPGRKFGYSQVVNPLYLVRKGTMTVRHATWLVTKNVLMNVVHFVRPEPYIDRRGRLRGNFIGFAHVLRGDIDPRHVLKL